jgi:hypothetical protein
MDGTSHEEDSRSWSRCVAMARELPVPSPFSLERFRAGFERWRGRPFALAAVPLRMPPGRGAVWVGTASSDYIFYEPSATPFEQVRAIAHQVGHLCAGHRGAALPGGTVAGLFPDLDPVVVAAELAAPAAFTEAQEREAEVFAGVLLSRILLPGPGSCHQGP